MTSKTSTSSTPPIHRLFLAVLLASSLFSSFSASFPMVATTALSHARRSILVRRGCARAASGSVVGGRLRTYVAPASRPSSFVSPRFLSGAVCGSDGFPSTRDSIPPRQGVDDLQTRQPNWTDYETLVRKLYMTNLFNPVKLGLENMNRLHEALGNPMDKVRMVPRSFELHPKSSCFFPLVDPTPSPRRISRSPTSP